MIAGLKRLARAAEDWLRYNARVRGLVSRLNLGRAVLMPGSPRATLASIRTLCTAARLATSDRAVQAIQLRLQRRLAGFDAEDVDWEAIVPGIHDGRLGKAAILKPYLGPREKGAVFISFETEWAKLICHARRDEFAGRYNLVIAPSSSPHNLVNYVFPIVYPGPIFSLISNPEDQAVLPRISKKFVVVPLYASQWVNPEHFQPLPRGERAIDLIMVANWAKFKRHFTLFRALRSMPQSLRIVLIGQDGEGRTSQAILEEARSYGVAERFEIRTNQRYGDVTRALGEARASVILSRREGSCVVVAESMFADTPVAILNNAELGSRVFINEHTGRLLEERHLARQLTEFVAQSANYSARRWAEEHISCWHSSRRLNEILKEHEQARGQDWTRDCAALQWSPDPRLASAEDRHTMVSERRAIHERFGLVLGQSVDR